MDEPVDDPEKLGHARAALLLKVWDDGEAEMIRQILLDYGIPSSVQSDVPHALFPLSVDGLGEIRVFVPEDRLDEAKEILAEHRRQGLELVDDRGEREIRTSARTRATTEPPGDPAPPGDRGDRNDRGTRAGADESHPRRGVGADPHRSRRRDARHLADLGARRRGGHRQRRDRVARAGAGDTAATMGGWS